MAIGGMAQVVNEFLSSEDLVKTKEQKRTSWHFIMMTSGKYLQTVL